MFHSSEKSRKGCSETPAMEPLPVAIRCFFPWRKGVATRTSGTLGHTLSTLTWLSVLPATQADVGTELSIPDASKKRWCRKPVKDLDPANHDLSFQQMDTDYYVQVIRTINRHLERGEFPADGNFPCFLLSMQASTTQFWLGKCLHPEPPHSDL
jgi:hypothetical protein